MRIKLTFKHILTALPFLALLGWGLYQLPPVHQRLGWRIDMGMAFVRGVLNPVDAVPTPITISRPPGIVTLTPIPSATLTPIPPLVSPTPTATQPSPTPTASPTPLPPAVSLSQPAYEKQGLNNCGPATLSMYLHYYGWSGDQTTITAEIKPFDEDRNVNVEELAYYVRNFVGWLRFEYRVGGDIDTLKKFIAAGIPVMIEGKTDVDRRYWPNDDLWAGHYLLATGYDDQAGVIEVMDSFRDYNKKMDYDLFLADWQSFNYVYILLFTPQQEEMVKAILGDDWDVDSNRNRALEKARAETAANPEDAFAWFNLGSNQVYFGQYAEAGASYDIARRIGLPQRMLRYQFGPFFAYFHSGRVDELQTLTEYALQITPNSEEGMLWAGWALYRQGDVNGAIEYFRQSYQANPTSQDSLYALNFVGASP